MADLTARGERGSMRAMLDTGVRDLILREIASGESMVAACKKTGVDRSVVYDVLKNDPDFADRYARASDYRADTKADEIDAIAEAVRVGELAPDAGRVVIDAKKWIAAKLRPKKYGDRIQQDIDQTLRVIVDDPTSAAVTVTATVLPPALPHDE